MLGTLDCGTGGADPLRLAIVIAALRGGGAERVTLTLAEAWSSRGHEVHLLTLDTTDDDHYAVPPHVTRYALGVAGVSRMPVTGPILANARRTAVLRRVLRSIQPDVVLGMMTGAAVLSVLASTRADWRVIAVEHNFPPRLPAGPMWERLRRLTYPKADTVVMLTSEGLDWLRETIGGARGVVIPNPVVYPITDAEPRIDPAGLVPPGRRVVLGAGRLAPQKAFGRLISAFASIADRYAEWDLVILGEGTERSSLEAMRLECGLERRVYLPGRAGNIGEWYSSADLYVLSSRFEGFPMTLVEAMASGCASVSYDCDTGPRDIIRDGVNGLLVTPEGDIDALASAMGQLMGSDSERQRLAAAGVEVRDEFSLDRILAGWDEILTGPSAGQASSATER